MIPLPYKLTIYALLFLGSAMLGFDVGYKWHKSKTDAIQLASIESEKSKRAELESAYNIVANRMVQAETTINNTAMEKLHHVIPKTTGRTCLDSATVSMLQPGNGEGFKQSTNTSKPTTESTAASSSDTDIAYWITEATRLYNICAERQNGLIDIVSEH